MSSVLLLTVIAALLAGGWLLMDTVGICLLAAAAIFATVLLAKIIREPREGK